MPSTASTNPRDQILQAIQRIYEYRMTTTSGGNLSIREQSGHIWITPARLDKGGLKREEMVCVRPNGTFMGPHAPSSELPFHKEIYRTREDIRGIVHAHPVALERSAWHIGHRTRLFTGPTVREPVQVRTPARPRRCRRCLAWV
jgi:L-fuculose-phosphate aldolase